MMIILTMMTMMTLLYNAHDDHGDHGYLDDHDDYLDHDDHHDPEGHRSYDDIGYHDDHLHHDEYFGHDVYLDQDALCRIDLSGLEVRSIFGPQIGQLPLLGFSYLWCRSSQSQYKCNIAPLRRTRRRQDQPRHKTFHFRGSPGMIIFFYDAKSHWLHLYAFLNVSSTCLPEQMQSRIGCICALFHQGSFQMFSKIACLNRWKVTNGCTCTLF